MSRHIVTLINKRNGVIVKIDRKFVFRWRSIGFTQIPNNVVKLKNTA